MSTEFFQNSHQTIPAYAINPSITKGFTADGNGNWLWVDDPLGPTPTIDLQWDADKLLTARRLFTSIDFRVPLYTTGTLPPSGQGGRLAFTTDTQQFLGDTGSTWAPLGSGGGSGSVTHTGALTNGWPIVGNGLSDIKAFPGTPNSVLFLNIFSQLTQDNPSFTYAPEFGLSTTPIGNSLLPTKSALNLEQAAVSTSDRQFLVNLGMTSGAGSGDNVTLYSGIVGTIATDIWSLNTVLEQSAASGSYNALGYELDFNNLNANRGDTDGGAGLAAPVSYGLAITGASTFRKTAAILISENAGMWNRGIVFGNDCISTTGSAIQDFGISHSKTLDIRGTPDYGVYVEQPSVLNKFAGGTIIGPLTTGTLPAAGNAGRLVYTTDDQLVKIDTGTVWAPVGPNSAIGALVSGGTVGSVLFVGPGPVLAQDNANFFWDDTNNKLQLTSKMVFDTNGRVDTNGFTAVYDLEAGIVASAHRVALGTQTVPNDKQLDTIRITGALNSNDDTTNHFLHGVVLNLTNSATVNAIGTDHNRVRGIIGEVNTDGPGSVRGLHLHAQALGASTGVVNSVNAQVTPVATTARANALSAVNTGSANIADALIIEGSGSTRWRFGINMAEFGDFNAAAMLIPITEAGQRGGLLQWRDQSGPTNEASIEGFASGIMQVKADSVQLLPFQDVANQTAKLIFLERPSIGTNYVGFKAPDSIASDVLWTLPSSDGGAGECLSTDGSGNLSWGPCSAGSGTGISSLNGLTASVQTFVNGPNVIVTSAGSQHTLGWAGQLNVARGGTGRSSVTTGALLVGNGTGALTELPPTIDGVYVALSGTPSLTNSPIVLTLFTTGQEALGIIPYGAGPGSTGEVRFRELTSNGVNYVGFKAPDNITTNRIWVLPSVDGTNGQVLTTNGAGVLNWTTVSGGGGGGITSLNTLTASSQVFVNDANVTITSSGSQHTLGWSGQLGVNRGGTGMPGGAPGALLYFQNATTIDDIGPFTTNAILLGNLTSGIKNMSSTGTLGQILHSAGAASEPTWGPVNLASGVEVSGNLPVTRLNSGLSANNTTFWRGDGTWAAPSTGTSSGIQASTFEALPPAASAGIARYVTNNVGGLFFDTGPNPHGVATSAQWYKAASYTVNVKEFGAKGDRTTNDTAAIQAAHDALPQQGGTIYIPAGQYSINAPINISKDVLIRGDGHPGDAVIASDNFAYGSVIRMTSTTQNGIVITGSPNSFIIRDLAIVAPLASTQTAGAAIRIAPTGLNMLWWIIDNVYTFNTWDSIVATHIGQGNIINSWFFNVRHHGINTQETTNSDATGLLIQGCQVSSAATTAGSIGINLGNGGTIISNSGVGMFENAIVVDLTPLNTSVSNIKIVSNIIENYSANGILFIRNGSPFTVRNVHLIGNEFLNGGTAINMAGDLGSGCKGFVITNNVSYLGTTGILVQSGDNYIISDNQLADVTTGISIGNGINASVGVNRTDSVTTPISTGGGNGVVYSNTRPLTFAQLPVASDGSVLFCTNCSIGSCGTPGTGALAVRVGGSWVCK